MGDSAPIRSGIETEAEVGVEIGDEVATSATKTPLGLTATSTPVPAPVSAPSIVTPSEWAAAEENLSAIVKDKKRALKVFCDREDHLNPSLMSPTQRIVLVSSPSEADVLYLIDHTISVSGALC